ncbi:MAG: zinc-dependent metalloprotease [Actinobacteria bacterium]|nr:zinc-dependent metalloprotease [Actinomycetota bacterium]
MAGDVPFGFGPQDSDDERESNEGDASQQPPGFGSTPPGAGGSSSGGLPPGFGGLGDLSGLAGAGGEGFDMANLGAALEQIGAMLQSAGNSDGSAVNWDMANDIARKALAEAGDPTVPDAQRRAVQDAVGLADVWLDPATEFPSTAGKALAWSRSEWLTETLPAWNKIITPIAEKVQGTMQTMMPGTDALGGGGMPGMPEGLPPELAAVAGPLMGMAKAMGSAMFGMQVGQGLAALAGDVVCSSDIGIPLTSGGHSALIPSNILAFGEGLELPDADVLVFIALREAAHQRLFAHVPWLRSRVEAALVAYASGINVDQGRIESALEGVDVQNPEALQAALASGVFQPEDTEEQKVALARLETLLALVEGWVDDVVDGAVGDRLPSYDRLRETLRRRRATGGPAEKTFATLVGLEMRPRRLREAAALWQRLRNEGGVAQRDALWAHPDLLPTTEDLDDIDGFLTRTSEFDTAALDTSELDRDKSDQPKPDDSTDD